MKKTITKILFIISFIPIVMVLFNIVKCYFFGYEVVMMLGLDIPLCYGFKAVYCYLWVMFSFTCFGIINIPVFLVCFLYQVFYIKKIKKSKNSNNS